MSRYRPPRPKSSPYITQEGYDRLCREEEGIWKWRNEVCQALSEAAAEGDRSENAEYIYRKKQLRQIDSRIRFLQRRIPSLKVVKDPPSDLERIFFGAWITVERESGEQITYRIVGPDEFDQDDRYISMDSPMGKALMGKRLDDEVKVKTPGGVQLLLVEEVDYSADPEGSAEPASSA